MPTDSKSGGELFIVDNSESEWKGLRYLQDWTDIASAFDIATGCFEIGALLALDGRWQKLDRLRILMGDEVSARTRQAIADALKQTITAKLDASLESEKERNDFLAGTAAIVQALRKGQIQCRAYTKRKFHAKAYITHPRVQVIGSVALVGSSNFTVPGLTQNVELNIQVRAPGDVARLQEWYEQHWQEAEDITPDVLACVERHVREYRPFDVYARALDLLFHRREPTADEWEQRHSRIHRLLDGYQHDGYRSLLRIAAAHHGALLCDGVGLGKTFIGLMLIERLILRERRKLLLIVPKSARESVWERHLKQLLPKLYGDYSDLVILNHTDLMRGGEFPARLENIKERADVVLIDEAHHFRNRGLATTAEGEIRSRYWRLHDLCAGKTVFLLTATPVNNQLTDLQYLLELFARPSPGARVNDAFASLGVHNLASHFQLLEKQVAAALRAAAPDEPLEVTAAEASQLLLQDRLFKELVVQRSRAYVKRSQQQQQPAGGGAALFPTREPPRVVPYSVQKTYGPLLRKIETAFAREKPLFALAPYHPLDYPLGEAQDKGDFELGRQRGLVRLIRVQCLKRFESSIAAFEQSCQNLLLKFLAFLEVNAQSKREQERLAKWRTRNADLLAHLQARRQELAEEDASEETEETLGDEFLDHFEPLDRQLYRLDEIFNDTFDDLETIVDFLEALQPFTPAHDDKLKALLKRLQSDPDLKGRKVLLFTEFMATARYLRRELTAAGVAGVDEVDSGSKRDRAEVLAQFSPYYNGLSSAELKTRGLPESRVLIATDVLSEGLNLQDATRLINYDLHWNPVRLMQRIGRVDRRLSPAIEARLVADHPAERPHRGKVIYWNFLPPDELDELLRLYERVRHKALRISKVFGIEGRKLLKPDDDLDALREFNAAYEPEETPIEAMQLELERLLAADPTLEARLDALPGRVFSGKARHEPGAAAVFFCYVLPAEDPATHEWTEAAGRAAWYLYDFGASRILDQPEEIHAFIRCQPDTPRRVELTTEALRTVRLKIEAHIKNTHLKQMQAPVGVKPILKCWMELS